MPKPTNKFISVLTLSLLTAALWSGCSRQSKGISGQIPTLTLKTHLGESYTLSGDGKTSTLVVFWATWCGPCMMEIPTLVELQEKFRGKNFRIVSINIDDPQGEKVKGIAANYAINYTILLGSDETTKQFGGVMALPTSFLVGQDGKIKEKVQGLLPGDELERKVEMLLAGTI